MATLREAIGAIHALAPRITLAIAFKQTQGCSGTTTEPLSYVIMLGFLPLFDLRIYLVDGRYPFDCICTALENT